jgi:hypothetical protein
MLTTRAFTPSAASCSCACPHNDTSHAGCGLVFGAIERGHSLPLEDQVHRLMALLHGEPPAFHNLVGTQRGKLLDGLMRGADFTFYVLGVILLGVSWIYTRFRERVAKFL